jgi:hypothetical protein
LNSEVVNLNVKRVKNNKGVMENENRGKKEEEKKEEVFSIGSNGRAMPDFSRYIKKGNK